MYQYVGRYVCVRGMYIFHVVRRLVRASLPHINIFDFVGNTNDLSIFPGKICWRVWQYID